MMGVETIQRLCRELAEGNAGPDDLHRGGYRERVPVEDFDWRKEIGTVPFLRQGFRLIL